MVMNKYNNIIWLPLDIIENKYHCILIYKNIGLFLKIKHWKILKDLLYLLETFTRMVNLMICISARPKVKQVDQSQVKLRLTQPIHGWVTIYGNASVLEGTFNLDPGYYSSIFDSRYRLL